MKKSACNLVISIFVLGLISTFQTNCKKDTPDNIPVVTDTINYFQFEGKKYVIDTCFCVCNIYHSSSGPYVNRINLLPDEVGYNDFLQELVGSGNGFVIDIVANSASSISGGTFTIDTSNNQMVIGEVYNASIMFNYDFHMNDGTIIDIHKGSVNLLSLNNNRYIITGDFATSEGKKVKINCTKTIIFKP